LKNISSNRIKLIKPSTTIALSTKAKKYLTQGKDVINVTTGELPFQAPKYIRDALVQALNKGKDKYVDPSGIVELKEAIVSKLDHENNINFVTDEISVGSGVKELFYNLMAATISDDDEVIIPVPYWVSFPEIVLFYGGNPIFLETKESNGFKMTADKLRAAITKKTKWLIINSPSNPTGSVYSPSELYDIARVLQEPENQHVSIISDDIYEKIIFDDCKFNNILNVAPNLKKRVFILNGFSKSYCMTGWRLGYGAGNIDLVKDINIIKSHSNTCTPSFIQYAGLTALQNNDSFVSKNIKVIKINKDLIVKGLNSISGISCIDPGGAFYVFPSCKNFFNLKTPKGEIIRSSIDFASYLLEEYNIAVVPGEAFGMSGYFRISYTIDIEFLKKLLDRLENACSSLH
jgi:aspartate aminotransferase